MIAKLFYLYKRRKIQKFHLRLIKKKNYFLRSENKLLKSNFWHETSLRKYDFKDSSAKEFFNFYRSVYGKDSKNFIPVPSYLFYFEPCLNDIEYAKVISDKNYYDKYLFDIKKPKTILRKINGFFYDSIYEKVVLTNSNLNSFLSFDSIIIKCSLPSQSGSGNKIELYDKENESYINRQSKNILDLKYLERYDDFIIQEVVRQHAFFKRFNPDSNNTIRILTYRSVKNDEIYILHRLLRIGKKGSFLDHDNKGGIVVGINDKGNLNHFGTNMKGQKFKTYNNIDFNTIEKIPYIEEFEKISRKIAHKFEYIRLLALDFTIDVTGLPLLIEINTIGNGTIQYQLNNGPLFGHFTDEILEYCSDKINSKRIKLDYKYFSSSPGS